MYLLIGLGFILLIIAIILSIIMIALYNQVLHLRNSCEQAVEDMHDTTSRQFELLTTTITDLDEDTFATEKISTWHKGRQKASTTEKKAEIIEALGSRCIAHQEQFGSLGTEAKKTVKKIITLDHELGSIKRFFNETVREYNERIQTFPVNLIASIMQLEPLKSFSLYPEDKHGIGPETKYI